jgi:purine catabolism regulator
VSLTVQQLVENPSLRTRFLAGQSGASKPVLWAHTCELPDPWNWLGTGDLLLADGYNFPADPEGQVGFLRGLAQANLSGIALAEGLHAAPLTPEATLAADDLALPVLETAYAVPFVTVARAVADSNTRDASGKLVRILRVYDVLRRSSQSGSSTDTLLERLGRECGANLHVVDVARGVALLPRADPLEPRTHQALVELLESKPRPFPAFMRLAAVGESLLVLPVGEGDRAVLLAESASGSPLDLVVLQHVATIASVDVERRAAAALRRRENGARLFQQLLAHSMDTDTAANRLAAAGLTERPWRVVCWGDESLLTAEDVQLRLTGSKVPHLLTRSGAEHLALVADSSMDPELFGYARVARLRAGVSQPVHSVGRIADAAREARWAMEAARSNRVPVGVYGEQTPTFLPRTVSEGEAAVAALLGPVIAYDEETDSELMHSLEVYFDANRSWQEGANRLGIHKQTLVYRIRRIEELTGRKLGDIKDQTEMYLALRTWQLLRAR